MQYPILSFFPAVQFARNLELGNWSVGTPAETVVWRAAPFRELATTLLECSEPKELKKPALLWHRERGFDGTAPTDEEARAIEAAVRFALLDYNDQVSRELNTAYYLATSENGVLYRQPIRTGLLFAEQAWLIACEQRMLAGSRLGASRFAHRARRSRHATAT